MKYPIDLILSLMQGFLIILSAPLLMGWIKQIKCWLQNRRASPLFQSYYTLYKLLIKRPVVAENASWLSRFAPYVYFVCMSTICFAIPFISTSTLSLHFMDIIVIIGLLALSRIILTLAAIDIGTAFGSLGARREMFIACLAEPTLLLVFLNLALLTHTAYLDQISLYFIIHPPALYPSLIFSFLALLLVMIAETGRVPIDNPATHLELTMIHEAMILEYSGRYLALIEWGNAIKLALYLGLCIALFMPFGISTHWGIKNISIGFITTFSKLFIISAFIGIIESINSKLRIFKVPDYLVSAFMLAVLGTLVSSLMESTL